MGWKTKRAVGTAFAAAIPYLAWTFVAADPAAVFSGALERAWFLFTTTFLAGATYTFPGWNWR